MVSVLYNKNITVHAVNLLLFKCLYIFKILHIFIFSFCRGSLCWLDCLVEHGSSVKSSPRGILCSMSSTHDVCMHPRNYSSARHLSRLASLPSSLDSLYIQRSNWLVARYASNASFEMDTNNDVVRFSLGKKLA